MLRIQLRVTGTLVIVVFHLFYHSFLFFVHYNDFVENTVWEVFCSYKMQVAALHALRTKQARGSGGLRIWTVGIVF